MRRCKLCGAIKRDEELEGRYCLRCEKISTDVVLGLVADSGRG